MNATRPRETFIALKARREGHQIAAEILNPPMEVPPELRVPLEVERIDPLEGQITYERNWAAQARFEPIDYGPTPRWIWMLLVGEILAMILAVAFATSRM